MIEHCTLPQSLGSGTSVHLNRPRQHSDPLFQEGERTLHGAWGCPRASFCQLDSVQNRIMPSLQMMSLQGLLHRLPFLNLVYNPFPWGGFLAQRAHGTRKTRRNWGVLLQLGTFLPVQTERFGAWCWCSVCLLLVFVCACNMLCTFSPNLNISNLVYPFVDHQDSF